MKVRNLTAGSINDRLDADAFGSIHNYVFSDHHERGI
jgi:hypothetical protein